MILQIRKYCLYNYHIYNDNIIQFLYFLLIANICFYFYNLYIIY